MLNLSEREMVIHILFLVCVNIAIDKKIFKKSWKRKKMLLKKSLLSWSLHSNEKTELTVVGSLQAFSSPHSTL